MIKVFYRTRGDQQHVYWTEQPDPLVAAVLMTTIECATETVPLGWTWGTHDQYAHLMAIRGGEDFGTFDFQAIVLPPTALPTWPCEASVKAPNEYFHRSTAADAPGWRAEFHGTVATALDLGMRPCPMCFPTLAPVITVRTELDR